MRVTPEYLAGLIDGEGCFGINRDKSGRSYHVRLDVGMTLPAKPVLEALRTQYGGVLNRTRKATDRWAEAWAWRVFGRELGAVLAEVSPFLNIKRPHAELLMAVILRIGALPKRRNGTSIWNDDLRQFVADARIRVSELNRKGPLCG